MQRLQGPDLLGVLKVHWGQRTLKKPNVPCFAPRKCAGISIIVRGKSALESESAMPDDLDITIKGGT